jgi:integrase
MGYPVGQCVFRLLPESAGAIRIISHEEEPIYLEHADGLLRDVATIMIETGMRPGEVFAMHGEHINLDGRYVFIPVGKTRFARRTIPLTDRAYVTLGRLWRLGPLFEGQASSSGGDAKPQSALYAPGFRFQVV